jgi:hypothetical protein
MPVSNLVRTGGGLASTSAGILLLLGHLLDLGGDSDGSCHDLRDHRRVDHLLGACVAGLVATLQQWVLGRAACPRELGERVARWS